eukprot:CAMPEP_0181505800 /NCGR_PEP_ID=MMETSP1110-20121109/58251_1 /TAXON_ID=174948 /ORGANISM="Symbiodinium sp., Strain CCMP421" /LENGTH=178 /DNA_ID=CAMNT_0023634809 /DNA_START=332 /DNA_END=868 /DNA_ORIENTATION=-
MLQFFSMPTSAEIITPRSRILSLQGAGSFRRAISCMLQPRKSRWISPLQILQSHNTLQDDVVLLHLGEARRIVRFWWPIFSIHSGLKRLATGKLHHDVRLPRQNDAVPGPVKPRGLVFLAALLEVTRTKIREARMVFKVPGKETGMRLGVAGIGIVVESLYRPLALSMHRKGMSRMCF